MLAGPELEVPDALPRPCSLGECQPFGIVVRSREMAYQLSVLDWDGDAGADQGRLDVGL